MSIDCVLLGRSSKIGLDSGVVGEIRQRLECLGKDFRVIETFVNQPFSLSSSLYMEAISRTLRSTFVRDYLSFVTSLSSSVDVINPMDVYILSRRWANYLGVFRRLVDECQAKRDCSGDLIDLVYETNQNTSDLELRRIYLQNLSNSVMKLLVRQLLGWMCTCQQDILDPCNEFFIDQSESCLRISCLPTLLTTRIARLVLFIGRLRRHQSRDHPETAKLFAELLESEFVSDRDLVRTIETVYGTQTNEIFKILNQNQQLDQSLRNLRDRGLLRRTDLLLDDDENHRVQFKWPVSILFKANFVGTYGLYTCDEFDKVHQLLAKLTLAQNQLANCWRRTLMKQSPAKVYALRWQMNHWVQSFTFYFHAEIIDHEFDRFGQERKKADSLDKLTDLFSNLIKNVNAQCSDELVVPLVHVLGSIGEFCEFVEHGKSGRELKLRLIRSKFETNLNICWQTMLKNDSNPAIAQLLAKLDYNGFMTNKN